MPTVLVFLIAWLSISVLCAPTVGRLMARLDHGSVPGDATETPDAAAA